MNFYTTSLNTLLFNIFIIFVDKIWFHVGFRSEIPDRTTRALYIARGEICTAKSCNTKHTRSPTRLTIQVALAWRGARTCAKLSSQSILALLAATEKKLTSNPVRITTWAPATPASQLARARFKYLHQLLLYTPIQ